MKSLQLSSRMLYVGLVRVLGLIPILVLTFGCKVGKSSFSSLGSLVQDQNAKKISLDVTELTISEGSAALINVILDQVSDTDTTVNISFLNTSGRFSGVPTSVVIPAQRLSKLITLQSVDDSIYQGTQVFTLTISDAGNSSTVVTSDLKITVNDNDSSPQVNFSSVSQTVAEGVGTATITVSLSGAVSSNVVVPYTLSGTATGSGTDYSISPASNVTITAGQTSANLTVTVNNDSTVESSETVIVTLGTPTNATLGATSVHTMTVTDDDLGAFSISGITGSGSPTDNTADSLLVGTVNPTVNWGASTGATSYDVTVYENDGTTVVCALQNTASTSYNFSGCTLTRGTTYKASVASKATGGSRAAANNLYSFSVNRLPIANNDGVVRIMKGSSSINLQVITASDSSTRGTVADSDPDSGDTLSITAVTQGANGGTVTNNTSYVSYAPASASFTGVDTFTYTLSDNNGETATGTVTVHVFDTYTWTGKVSSDWSVNGNWCGTITNNSCNGSTGYPNNSATSTHVAIFDGTCAGTGHTCTATTSAATQAYGIRLASGFTGTLTQAAGNTLTIGNGWYSQAAGTFVGGNSTISIGTIAANGTNILNVSGGSFTSTSGTLTLATSGNVNATLATIGSSVTFAHNSGTVKFAPKGGWGSTITYTVDVPDLFTFFNIVIGQGDAGAGFNIIQPVSGRSIIAANDLTHGANDYANVYAASKIGGLWQVKRHLIIGQDSFGGTGTITFNGTGTQNYSYTTGGRTGSIIVDKSAGQVVPNPGTTNLYIGKFTLQTGTFRAPSGLMDTVLSNSGTATLFTIASGTTFQLNSGTVRFSPIAGWGSTSTFTVDVPDLFTFNKVVVHQGTSGAGTDIVQPVSGRTIVVASDFTHGASEFTSGYAASMVGGLWQVQGNLIVGTDAFGGSGTITLNGIGAQTYSYATGGRTAGVTINNTSGAAVDPAGGTTDLFLGKFDLQAGTFNAPSGTMDFLFSTSTATTLFKVANTATFNHNNGTMKFAPIAGWGTYTNFYIDVPDLFAFYNVIIHQGASGAGWNMMQPVSGRTIVVNNNFIHGTSQYGLGAGSSYLQGLWHVKGNYTTGTDSAGGDALVTFNGTGTQQWSSTGTLNGGAVTIDKSSGSVVLTSNVMLNTSGQDFFITNGTLDMAGFLFRVMRNISNSGILQTGTSPSCGTLQYFGSYTGNAAVCP